MKHNDLPLALQLSAAAWDAVLAGVERAAPNEGCGALLGRSHGRSAHVLRALRTPNRAARPACSYSIPARTVRRVDAAARRAGLELLGFYHSHPGNDAAPSATDLEQAFPGYIYLIVPATARRIGEGAAWRLRDDRSTFRPVPLQHAAP